MDQKLLQAFPPHAVLVFSALSSSKEAFTALVLSNLLPQINV